MALFRTQQEAITRALSWLRKADEDFARAKADYEDPSKSYLRGSNYRRMIDARHRMGFVDGSATGSGKSVVQQSLCITKGTETKLPALILVRKSLVANNIKELLERSIAGDLPYIHPTQIIPISGPGAHCLEMLEQVQAMQGKAFLYVIGNPDKFLPSTEKRKKLTKARIAKLDDEEGDEDDIDPIAQDKIYKLFQEIRWSIVAVDEFHSPNMGLANTASQMYQFLYETLAETAQWRIGTSATAFPNKPKQFYDAMSWFQPGLLGTSCDEFTRNHFKMRGDRVERIYPGWELAWKKINERCVYACKLSDVVELPPMRIVYELVDISKTQRKYYDMLRAKFVRDLDDEIERVGYSAIRVMTMLPRLLRMRQCVDDVRLLFKAFASAKPGDWIKDIPWERSEGETSPKIDHIEDIFLSQMGKIERAVVYTQWTEAGKLIRDDLTKRGVVVDMIDGKVSADVKMHAEGVSSARLEKCEGLNRGATELLIITDAAKEGLNLPRANHLIGYDVPWRYDSLQQALGRIRRPSPPDIWPKEFPGPYPVTVHLLIAKNTLEQNLVLPRVYQSARAAGMFTKGLDLREAELSELFAGDDDSPLASLLSRDDLVSSL